MKKYFRGKKGENVNFFIFARNSRFFSDEKNAVKNDRTLRHYVALHKAEMTVTELVEV